MTGSNMGPFEWMTATLYFLSLLIFAASQTGKVETQGNELFVGRGPFPLQFGASFIMNNLKLTSGSVVKINLNIVNISVPITIDVWREHKKISDNVITFRLAGSYNFTPTRTGEQSFQLPNNQYIGIKDGDVLGLTQMVIGHLVIASKSSPGSGDDIFIRQIDDTNPRPKVWGYYNASFWASIIKLAISVDVNKDIKPGSPGPNGQRGPIGPPGPPGPPGAVGSGPPGLRGPKGPKGVPGVDAVDGPAGQNGDYGAQGAQGPPGRLGPRGRDGTPGAKGERGFQGPAGVDGSNGGPGDKGFKGAKGDIGRGPRGDQGFRGELGDIGPPGKKGDPGWLKNNCTQQCNTCPVTDVGKECGCKTGFVLNENRNGCVDKRCTAETNYGMCHHKCELLPNKEFKCVCEKGFTLERDNRTCIAIDYCSGNPCESTQTCISQPNKNERHLCFGPSKTGTVEPPKPVTGRSGDIEKVLAPLKKYEVFIGLIIWLCVLTVASIVILFLIIYRIKQIRNDIKIHLMIASKQIDDYVMGSAIIAESNI